MQSAAYVVRHTDERIKHPEISLQETHLNSFGRYLGCRLQGSNYPLTLPSYCYDLQVSVFFKVSEYDSLYYSCESRLRAEDSQLPVWHVHEHVYGSYQTPARYILSGEFAQVLFTFRGARWLNLKTLVT